MAPDISGVKPKAKFLQRGQFRRSRTSLGQTEIRILPKNSMLSTLDCNLAKNIGFNDSKHLSNHRKNPKIHAASSKIVVREVLKYKTLKKWINQLGMSQLAAIFLTLKISQRRERAKISRETSEGPSEASF